MDSPIVQTLFMAAIAFVMSMAVAAVIGGLYSAMNSPFFSRYWDAEAKKEYNRARKIRKIRLKRLAQEFEKMEKGDLFDFYKGINRQVHDAYKD